MSARPTLDVGRGLLTVGVAVLFGIGAFFVLAEIAQPANYGARRDLAASRIAAAEAVLEEHRGASAFAPTAVCGEGTDKAASSLKARVQAAATATGITVANLTTAPATPGLDNVALNAVALQFEASGRYDQMVSMLATLSRQTPTLFLDTADLSSETSSVDFKLSGRVFCSASA